MMCLHVEEEENKKIDIYNNKDIEKICACRLLRYVKIEIFKMSLCLKETTDR